MRSFLHSWRGHLIASPEDHAEAARINHWLVVGILAVLLTGEAFVAATYAPGLGVFLIAVTGTVGYLARRGERFAAVDRRRAMERYAEQRTEALRTDNETGLPNRQLLIEQLNREIARAERYRQPVTLAVVTIGQYEQLKGHWGPETTREAINHVAETLRRITRQSDFIARIDESRFAVVLVSCALEQARVFGERIAVAAANRSIHSEQPGKLPIYLNCEVSVLEYEAERYRGPLAFLSAAGGEFPSNVRNLGRAAARDGHALRRQLITRPAENENGETGKIIPFRRRAS